ncbi:hypothetical protein SAMN04489713_107149 [Actinomadura madurae]|uniref:Uncharacterized protein n=1 Tax=Actinomadura madurae TaxID=1993 RepID=A0A1I5I5Z3_9ACTN|nr:hypothetical protein SAMN04489713_107149 [Actinomadura madurae]
MTITTDLGGISGSSIDDIVTRAGSTVSAAIKAYL